MSTETASKSWKNRGTPSPVKNPGAPHRKAHTKLSRRIGDYSRAVDASRDGLPGYTKPGSMNRFAN